MVVSALRNTRPLKRMHMQPIISVSGLRGIVGESLTPTIAIHYVCALAAELAAGPIVLTRDGRATGRMLADAVRSGLQAVGRDVLDADVAATPTTGLLIRQFGAAGGIQISASHNPPEYNGLKLFGAEGRVIPDQVGARVLERYQDSHVDWVDHASLGTSRAVEAPHDDHLRRVLEIVDVKRIRQRKFSVLLDSNHGAGGLLGTRLLAELGCEIVALGAEPTGKFAHPPEPTTANLADVGEHVRSSRASVGFCQDPDADRLALIDEQGKCVGEEFTLAICLDHVLRQTPGPVVTNCSTSRMSQDLAEKHGVPFSHSKVGEANVADVMIANQAVFGGEGNGGPIDPRIGFVRDSFVGMALVLDAMASRNLKVSELAKELPSYQIHKTKVTLPAESVAPLLDRLATHFSEATASRLDGLRLDWPNKWLLVRASNTEPIVRLIAEATSLDEAQGLCERASQVAMGLGKP
jgi:phosphomannomutase